MNADAVRNWLVYLNLAAKALLIASILWTKLFKVHPFFLAYLLADGVQLVLLIVYDGNTVYDQPIYMVGSSLNLLLVILAIRQVSRVTFEDYSGLAEFSERASGYLGAASVVAALSLAALDPSVSYTKGHLLQHFYTLERIVYSTLLIYLLAVSVFMAWFPVRIRRTVAIFIGGFVAFFASQCAVLLLVNRTRRTAPWLTLVVLAVSLLCAAMWLAAFQLEGQDTMTVTGIRWNPGALAKLTRQLEHINASLKRFARAKPE
jgi:hypothetical protein